MITSMKCTLHAFEFGVDGLWSCVAAVALPHRIFRLVIYMQLPVNISKASN